MKERLSAFIMFIYLLVTLILSGCESYMTVSQSAVLYTNTRYGFSFTLPGSWREYTIVDGVWEGLAQDSLTGENVVETGPLISIRHPKWTSQNPRQDIPIMVFTLNQWNSLQQGKSHIGAAPIGPRELGRNSSCVFALPARYNYAFPEGYKEVETILNAKPLKPLPIIKE